jgi:polar amino acid transport system substrate-binding protein
VRRPSALLGAAVGVCIVSASVVSSSQTPASLVKEMAPTGRLRAGINYNNPVLARRDAATGEISGIAADLSRELGRRLGVPVDLVAYDATGKMAAAAASGAWDIAFLGIDPSRATEIDFTAPYINLEGTYLVRAGSPLRTVDDVDRDGVRVAVTAKSAYDLFLSRQLTRAHIVRADSTPGSIRMMIDQKLDAVAGVRTALAAEARRTPGLQVMSGHFMTIPQAAGIPTGRPAAARFVRQFIEDMKASGFVAASLARHGLGSEDAVVAGAAPAQ